MTDKGYDETLKEIFHETCFNIGFCFNEMEQFDRAVYYLDLIQGCDNIKYNVEYINALVNGKDVRSLYIVDRHLREFNEGKKKIDTKETSLFYDFLWRRLVYLHIEYKMWDEARKLLEMLRKSPSNRDFAVSELKYLDEISRQ